MSLVPPVRTSLNSQQRDSKRMNVGTGIISRGRLLPTLLGLLLSPLQHLSRLFGHLLDPLPLSALVLALLRFSLRLELLGFGSGRRRATFLRWRSEGRSRDEETRWGGGGERRRRLFAVLALGRRGSRRLFDFCKPSKKEKEGLQSCLLGNTQP